MADRAWKATERAIAAKLGGQRVPVSGRARGSAPDIAHPLLCPEVKHRRRIPDWLHDAMSQAQASVTGDQLPIVVLHQHNTRHDGDLVVMQLGNFVKLYGGARRELLPHNNQEEV